MTSHVKCSAEERSPWLPEGPITRCSTGFEDVSGLIADLEYALAAFGLIRVSHASHVMNRSRWELIHLGPRPSAPLASLHKCFERIFESRIPARERWAILNDVVSSPKDAALILLACGFVVLAKDVEVAARDAVDEPLGNLIGKPSTGRLLRHPPGHISGKGQPGNQQVRGYPAIGKITQRVGQTFG